MLILLRALTYATLFVAFFLVMVPQRILRGSGYKWSGSPSWSELTGMGLVIVGFALVMWCLATFAFVGKGTAAPFDPPRRLVVAGPYRFVRNPIYIGAVMTMLGAAMYLWTAWLVAYALGVLIVTHLLVILYEEPHLRRVFGQPYEDYLRTVHRWIPTWRS
jgi:protein-S-isoprenylcysteine O-methyltransferase Ste14